MNPRRPVPPTTPETIDAIDAAAEGGRRCGDQRLADCPVRGEPAEATITLTTTQAADLVELLEEIDQFLRIGEHGIDALTDFYATVHHDIHPGFAARCLVDSVGFTALGLRQQAHAAARDHAARR